MENKTPNETKYPFRGLRLCRAWGSRTRPLLYTRMEPTAEDQNVYWEVNYCHTLFVFSARETIFLLQYLCPNKIKNLVQDPNSPQRSQLTKIY